MRGKVRFGFIHDRGSRDHPRLCGEKPLRHFPDTMRQGSPPPMRGKACRFDSCRTYYQDHPRLCGEKFLIYCQQCNKHRITPAYAGKSFQCNKYRHPDWDHPRLCGEKSCHVRRRQSQKGITPAYAGKSKCRDDVRTLRKDHPRLCGEKHLMKSCVTAGEGSPPPMRGKADDISNYYLKLRITPAYAGKSFERGSTRNAPQDHPRLCGEKRYIYIKVFRNSGSPPPMRGKVFSRIFVPLLLRITPAYAGKSYTLLQVF